jgi:hypothetical protein
MPKSRNWLESLPFAPMVSAMFAGVAAILVGATPYWLFVRSIAASGLPSVLPAANPPIGDTARLIAMAAAAVLGGLVAYILARFAERAFRRPPVRVTPRGAEISPVTQSVDQDVLFDRPIASRRPPLFADRDLGAPLMSDEAFEHARDELILDAPIADAEEQSVEFAVETHVEPIPVEPAVIEVSPEIMKPAAPEPAPMGAVDALPIAALMARLEQGIATRPQGMPPLRNLGAFRAAH